MAFVLPEKSDALTTSGTALRMRENDHIWKLFAHRLDILNRKLLMDFTASMPANHLNIEQVWFLLAKNRME